MPRRDDLFLAFLDEVAALLARPDIPPSTAGCAYCAYRSLQTRTKPAFTDGWGEKEVLVAIARKKYSGSGELREAVTDGPVLFRGVENGHEHVLRPDAGAFAE